MPIPPIEVIQKFMFVINCLVEEDLPQLDQLVTINGHLNDNGIQQLENILLQTGRDDVLEILHETLAGELIMSAPIFGYSHAKIVCAKLIV
jgi:hypothetical protein